MNQALFSAGMDDTATGYEIRGNLRRRSCTDRERRTESAGAVGIAEAFVIYRPTGQILWALVDGAGQDSILLARCH